MTRHLEPGEFDRWYGGWDPLDPTTVGDFMAGFERPWWIIGGWSIEAFTGVPRAHEDMDISILSSDAEALSMAEGPGWAGFSGKTSKMGRSRMSSRRVMVARR